MSDKGHDHDVCLEMFAKLSEYLDNELDTITCENIEAHASTCISCRVCLKTLERTIDLCKQTKGRSVPKTFSHRLMETIAQLK